MKTPSVLRAHDWWAPKIIPLLCIGYATIMQNGYNLLDYFLWLLFLILAIAATPVTSIFKNSTVVNLSAGKPSGYFFLFLLARHA